MSAPQQSPEIGAACEPWDCDGSGLSRQGWSPDDGDQYGPCGQPCRAPEKGLLCAEEHPDNPDRTCTRTAWDCDGDHAFPPGQADA